MNDREFETILKSPQTNAFDPSSLSESSLEHNQTIFGDPLSHEPLGMPSFEDAFEAIWQERSQGSEGSELEDDASTEDASTSGFLAPTNFSVDQVVAHFPSLDSALESGSALWDRGTSAFEQVVESGSLLAKDKFEALSDTVQSKLEVAWDDWNASDNSLHNALDQKIDETVEEVSELADSVGRSHWWAKVKQRIDNAVDATSTFTEKLSESLGYGVSNSDISKEEAALESATSRLADNLMDFTADPNFEATIKTAFGDQADIDRAEELIEGIAEGEGGPEIEVIDAKKLPGQGAFDGENYLISDDLLEGSHAPLDKVLLEEAGHYLGQKLSNKEQPGDEGALFVEQILDGPLSDTRIRELKQEDDQVVLEIDNALIAVEQSDNRQTYDIKSGDTLWDIAERELGDGNRWTELQKEDGSNFAEAEAKKLQVGATIFFEPLDSSDRQSYEIKSGDTLWDIAERELGDGNRWKELQKEDGSNFAEAEAENLAVGQLVFFKPLDSGDRQSYEIKSGDTLWDIAERELGDGNRWQELQKEDGSSFSESEAENLAVGQLIFFTVSEDASGPPNTSNIQPTVLNGIEYGSHQPPVDQAFLDKVAGIAERVGMPPEYLIAVMGFETGGHYTPDVRNPNSSATGLIQFVEKTARGLGTSTKELASMTALEQLDFVEKHLQPYSGKFETLEDAYMAVLWPAAVGQGPDKILFSEGSQFYSSNAGLDGDADGTISAREATDKVRKYLPSAALFGRDVTESSPQQITTETDQFDSFDVAQLKEEVNSVVGERGLTSVFSSDALSNLTEQINAGLTSPKASYLSDLLGAPAPTPYQEYGRASVSDVQNEDLRSLMVEGEDVGPFKVTGLKPAVEALKRVFARVEADDPELYASLGTAGMLHIRAIRPSKGGWGNSFSTHSWGATIDITIDGTDASREPQAGLLALAPYFREEGFRWGESFNDAMHFEASKELLEFWASKGYFDGVSSAGNNGAISSSSASPSTSSSSSTSKVREVQNRLLELGYKLPKYGADGDLGDETKSALRVFQVSQGLQEAPASGRLDNSTIEALLGWEHLKESEYNDSLGTINNGVSVQGRIGANEYSTFLSKPANDTSDVYKFSINRDKGIKLHLGGLQAGSDLTLRDSNFKIIASSDGLLNNSIVKNLEAGDYYVGVSNTKETEYRLSVFENSVSTNISTPDGEISSSSTSPSTSSSSSTSKVREVQNRLLELGYKLPKYGADGDLGDETKSALRVFQVSQGLQEAPASGRLDNSTIEALLGWEHLKESEYNDSLGTINNGVSVQGRIGANEYSTFLSKPANDTSDVYKFSINRDKGIKLHLGGLQAGSDLTLRDSNFKIIASSDGLLNNSIVKNLEAGDYYVGVSNTKETEYRLSVFEDSVSTSNISTPESDAPTSLTPQEYIPQNFAQEADASFSDHLGSAMNYLWETLQGDWNQDSDPSQDLVNLGVGLIPVADQVLDVRDFAAHLYYMIGKKEYDDPMRWVGLGLTGIGAVPTIGSVIKGLGKLAIFQGGISKAAEYAEPALKAIRKVDPDWADVGQLRQAIDSNWDDGVAATKRGLSKALDMMDELTPSTDNKIFGVLSKVPLPGAGLIRQVDAINDAIPLIRQNIDKLDSAFDEIKEAVDDMLGKFGKKHACSSFIAGTEILTPNGVKNIEDIQIGDWVIADDPTTPGEVEPRQVLNTFSRQVETIIDLNVDGEVISTTTEHPFWVEDKGWVEAENLEEGMLLQTDDETLVEIDNVNQRNGEFDVYNFEVDDFHTYFVSDSEVLVHNTNCELPSIQKDPYAVKNALSNFESGKYYTDGYNFTLTRSNMTHMLERHHPSYWKGQVTKDQGFFNKNMSIDEIKNAAIEVMKQNQERVSEIAPMLQTLTREERQIDGVVDGIKYTVGLNHQFQIGQFYPVVRQ